MSNITTDHAITYTNPRKYDNKKMPSFFDWDLERIRWKSLKWSDIFMHFVEFLNFTANSWFSSKVSVVSVYWLCLKFYKPAEFGCTHRVR